MSKNSFTKNFNNCVTGFPIVSVAAHMVLHEGLGKDLLKVGVPAAMLAGLYHYGDDMAQGISDWGANHQDMKLGGWNIGQTAQDIGNKLNDWHTAGTHWAQDSIPGRWAGLGGTEALKRQTINDTAEKYATDTSAALQSKINDIYKNQSLTPMQQEQQINATKEQFKLSGQRAGENAWLQKQGKLDSMQSGGNTNSGSLHAAENQYNKLNGLNQPPNLPDANKAVLAGANAGASAATKLTPEAQKEPVETNHSETPLPPNSKDLWNNPTVGQSRKLVNPDPNLMKPVSSQPNQQTQVATPTEQQVQPVNKTLKFDYSKYNSQAQAIPAGAEFGLTAPESRPSNIEQPSQQQQQNVKVGGNLFQTPNVQHRGLVTPNIPAQTNTTSAQQPTGQASGGLLHHAEQQSGVAQNQPVQGMKLNANPEMTKNLIGRQSYSAGTNSNLSDVQNPVFSGKKRQFLNGSDFNTQNQLKQTTIGGSFSPTQNQARPSPFGPRSNQNQKS